MIGTLPQKAPHPPAADPAGLNAHLAHLVGQPFLFARFSYPDELNLHFGVARPYDYPKLRHLEYGSYSLGTRASAWYMQTAAGRLVVQTADDDGTDNPPPGFDGITKQEIEQGPPITAGAVVVAARAIPVPTGFAVRVEFSDGASVYVQPELPPAGDDPADWELFTPFDRVLTAGPGPVWAYEPSNEPPPTTNPA